MDKALPLKQRTSSVDQRSDFTHHAWTSLLGLLKPREFFITVDHFSIWRRHLAWAKKDGKDLRNHMTQRFSSNMVFMSLLLASELNILFSSSQVATYIRADMKEKNHNALTFWVGIVIILSVVFTLLTLLSTLTAWAMVSSLSDKNALYILRSSIGLYAAHLPARLTLLSIYTFFAWVIMYLFVLLPNLYSTILMAFIIVMFLHVVVVFSTFGRLIMHTGAMGSKEIFDTDLETQFLPRNLHNHLLSKAFERLKSGTSITRQYDSFSNIKFSNSCSSSTDSNFDVESKQTSVRFSDDVDLKKDSPLDKYDSGAIYDWMGNFRASDSAIRTECKFESTCCSNYDCDESLFETDNREIGTNTKHHRRISSLSVTGITVEKALEQIPENGQFAQDKMTQNPDAKDKLLNKIEDPKNASENVNNKYLHDYVKKCDCNESLEDKGQARNGDIPTENTHLTAFRQTCLCDSSSGEQKNQTYVNKDQTTIVLVGKNLGSQTHSSVKSDIHVLSDKEYDRLLSGGNDQNYNMSYCAVKKTGILQPYSMNHKITKLPSKINENPHSVIINGLQQSALSEDNWLLKGSLLPV